MKNKIFSLVVLIMSLIMIGCGSNFNLTGQWEGKMIQAQGPRGNAGYNYAFQITQKDSIINGIARIEIPQSQYFAEMKLEGVVRNDSLYFSEPDILKQNERQGYFWCLKKGVLGIDKKEKVLKGNWTSTGCAPGTIYLKKVK